MIGHLNMLHGTRRHRRCELGIGWQRSPNEPKAERKHDISEAGVPQGSRSRVVHRQDQTRHVRLRIAETASPLTQHLARRQILYCRRTRGLRRRRRSREFRWRTSSAFQRSSISASLTARAASRLAGIFIGSADAVAGRNAFAVVLYAYVSGNLEAVDPFFLGKSNID